MNAGVTFFDTSDVYGYKSAKDGYSAEHLLGRFAEENVRHRAFDALGRDWLGGGGLSVR